MQRRREDRVGCASSNSNRRPQMINSAPSSTKRRPIAAPSPEPPPVTNIRFAASRFFSNIVPFLPLYCSPASNPA
jgi:hypothetical protein